MASQGHSSCALAAGPERVEPDLQDLVARTAIPPQLVTSSPGFSDKISKLAARTMVLLLIIDAMVLLAHLTLPHGPQNRFFDLTSNGGLGEIIGYIKLGAIVLLLGWLWRRTEQAIYVVWAVIFTVLLADDVFRLHEQMGYFIFRATHIPQFLLFVRGRDVGEILYLGNCAILFAIGLAAAWTRSSEEARGATVDISLAVAVLAMFGVGFDFLHEASRGLLGNFFAIAEDLGELMTMSLLTWLCAHLALSQGKSVPASWVSFRERILSVVPKSRRIPRLASVNLLARQQKIG